MSGNGTSLCGQLAALLPHPSPFPCRTEIDITDEQRWFKDGMAEQDIDQLQLGEEHH